MIRLIFVCGLISISPCAAHAFVTTDIVYPSCDVPAPRSDERVTTIFADRGQGVSTVTLGADTTFTEVVDIEIEEADRPHYIALASGGAIIWRFSGRIDTVSRVVVFGAQDAGHLKNGVIGIPRERIVFLEPDRESPDPRDEWSSNWLWRRACEPEIYFDISPTSFPLRLGSPRSWSKETPTYPNRFATHQHIISRRAGLLRIPRDGNIEPGEHRYMPSSQLDGAHERGLIAIDASAVVSQAWASPYDVLPSWAGIQQLIEAGVLIPPSDPRFRPIYDHWNDAISRPYQTPLVRDFRLSYSIDYIIAKPTQLPARARGTFLLSPGIQAPDLEEEYDSCVFFADLRPFSEKKPMRRGRLRRDPRCDERLPWMFELPGETTRRERDSELSESVKQLADAMEKQAELAQKCRTIDLPDNTPLVGILMENARAEQLAEKARDITVEIKRPGKMALYIEPYALFDWHIESGPETEVVAVLYKEGVGGATPAGKRMEALAPSTELRNLLPSSMDEGCRDLRRTRPTPNNVPGDLVLDHELRSLTGRSLQTLLTKESDVVLQPATGSETARWLFTVR